MARQRKTVQRRHDVVADTDNKSKTWVSDRISRLGHLRQDYKLDQGPWPTVGAAVAAGAGVALTAAVGVGELAVGAAAAYAAYQMLRHGKRPLDAVRRGVKVGQGEATNSAH